jgi:hypothetical protein
MYIFTWLSRVCTSKKENTMHRRLMWLAPAALVSVGLLACLRSVEADEPLAVQSVGGDKGRDDVATCLKIEGALLKRAAKGGPFSAVKSGDHLPPHTLLIGFPEAELVSSCGRVKIHLHLYFGDMLPLTEAAIILNDSPQLNADITLERGIIRLEGLGKEKDTAIRVRGPADQVWELTLVDADASVLVARFGRHEPGTKLFKTAGKKAFMDEPLLHLGVLVLKGKVKVNTGSATYTLSPPPGPALVTWDSGTGYNVRTMEKLPDGIKDLDTQGRKNYKEVIEMTAKLAAGDMGKGLDELVASDSKVKQRVAVACMAALDDMPRLVAALENPKSFDVRDQAILALRNWIGRQPGQITKLFEFLTKERKFTPVQGRTIIQLLRGFDDDDRKDPVLYQLLIDGLEFAPLPIRELAHWHLDRLAPAGQSIHYDAGASQEERSKAAAAWRKLIPDGCLPPPPPKTDSKVDKN